MRHLVVAVALLLLTSVGVETSDGAYEHAGTAEEPAERCCEAGTEQEEHAPQDEESVANEADADREPLVVVVKGFQETGTSHRDSRASGDQLPSNQTVLRDPPPVWLVWTSVAAGSGTILHLVPIGVIPPIVAGLAGWILTRRSSSWHLPALGYVAVYAAEVSTGLPSALGSAHASGRAGIAWMFVGITLLGTVTLVSAAVTWRTDHSPGTAPSSLSRVVAGGTA